MQAIQTKLIGPTNYRGARIKASAFSGSITVAYPDADNTLDAHKIAALALCEKMNWTDYGNLIAGGTTDGFVFVFEPRPVAKMRDALGNLCQHVAGNRGTRSGNPYSVPEMKDALQALHYDQTGFSGADFSDYANAADPYRVKSLQEHYTEKRQAMETAGAGVPRWTDAMQEEEQHKFYTWLADAIGVTERDMPVGLDDLMASKSAHMMDIPLKLWESRAQSIQHRALKAGMTSWLSVDTIACLKAYALNMVKAQKAVLLGVAKATKKQANA